MQTATALWLALLLVLAAPAARADSFQAAASASTIDDSESVQVTFRYSGDPGNNSPDFSALADDFEILFSRREEQIRMGLGRTERWVDWQLGLAPRRRGQLLIPALELNGERTRPITITVRAPDPGTRQRMAELVFFDTRVDRQQVYVQAQLLYTVELWYASDVQLYGDVPPAPALANAIVQAIGGVESGTENRNGRRYQVIRQRYAIFPQASGSLDIPAEAMSVSARLPARRGQRPQRRELRVRSEALRVQVLPPPPEWPADAPWLPAIDLELADDLQGAEAPLTAGTPLNRDILIRGIGVPASLLPELPLPQLPGVRSYPDPPVLREEPGPEGITGLRLQGLALIPQTAGTLELPATALRWYDVAAGTVRTAHLPARRLTVLPAAGTTAAPAPELPAAPVASAPAAAPPPAPSPLQTLWQALAPWWWLLLALAGSGWLVVMWLVVRRRRAAASRVAASSVATEDPQAALLAACAANDARAAQRALLRWQATARPIWTPELQAAADALAASRWQPGQPADSWSGTALAAAVRAANRTVDSDRNAALRPLYQ